MSLAPQCRQHGNDLLFAAHNLGQEYGVFLGLDIKVDLTVDGEEAVAVADSEFLLKWAEAYKNNNGIYITAQIVDAEGKTISACPGVGANGVDVMGAEM